MVKNNEMHNINTTNDGYNIFKTIKKKYHNFGFFKDKQTAIDIRDYLEENKWQVKNGVWIIHSNDTYYQVRNVQERIKIIASSTNKEKLQELMKQTNDMSNIYKTKHGTYSIARVENNERSNYKVYSTLEEAISMRDWLIKHNWNYELFLEEYNNRYVLKSQDNITKQENRYRVYKQWGKIIRYYGMYNTLEEAMRRRDYLIEHNWETRNIQVITEHDGIWYVRKNSMINKKPVKKFYYKTESKEEAIIKAEEYKINGYPEAFLITNTYRYIHHNRNMYYIIRNHKKYGYAYNLKDAVIYRTILETYNWNKPPEGDYIFDDVTYVIEYNSYNNPIFKRKEYSSFVEDMLTKNH